MFHHLRISLQLWFVLFKKRWFIHSIEEHERAFQQIARLLSQ